MNKIINNSAFKENVRNKKRVRKYAVTYLVILIILVLTAGAFFLGAWQAERVSPANLIKNVINKDEVEELSSQLDFGLFWDVWQKVKENHLAQPVNEKDMLYGAIEGVVSSVGDPYSLFFDPDMTEQFQESVDGSFQGVGIEIGIRDDLLTVIAPIDGTPAANAGLLTGDIITAIDGEDTYSMTLEYAVTLIRGEKGSDVVLTIFDTETSEFRDVTITRDNIVIKSVDWEMKDNIAYVRISHFNEDTGGLFNQIATEILLENPSGIIVDLRGNPGGYLASAIEIGSVFIDSGEIIVIEKFSSGELDKYKSFGSTKLQDLPIVVLVNEGSASASEILAGAMQDHSVATIVGMKTFGKGSIQTYEEFSDGSSLKLTIANWLTPNERVIDGLGVSPDVEIDLTREEINNGQDPQLDKAIEIINQ